jgi:two-component system CheB/CheR fusion protein
MAAVSAWFVETAEAERAQARFAALAEAGEAAVGIVTHRGLAWANRRLSGRLGLPEAAAEPGGPGPPPGDPRLALEDLLARLAPESAPRTELRAALDAAWAGQTRRIEITAAGGAGAAGASRLDLHPLSREAEPAALLLLTPRERRREPGRDALRGLGLYLAALAGDLRGPLGAFQEHLAGLAARDDLPPDLSQSLGLYRAVTADALGRLARVLEWGRQRPSREPVDLRRVVERARAAVEPVAGPGVTWHLELAAVPVVMGVPEQMELAVEHLLRNAAEALAGRGGHVRVSLAPAGSRVRLEVADDGPGIPPSLVPHVFDPFSSTKSIVAGLGLGLPVVRDIVERHGGEIAIASDGRGTRVTLLLPPGRAPAAARPPGRRRVLVVDDNRELQQTYRALLGAAGWEVDSAESVDEALDRLDEDEPDALLVDVQMAGRDGLGLVEALALWRPHLLPAAALVTGYADEPRVRRAAQRHGLRLLQKPCSYDTLLGTLQALVRRRAAAPRT